MMQSFGGSIWREDTAGMGERVWITMPMSLVLTTEEDLTTIRKAVESRLTDESETAYTLLLRVEDKELQDVLASELTTAGYRVVVAASMMEILPLARSEGVDLVILDLQAREPTALDIAKLLRQDTRTKLIPLLFLTLISDAEGGIRMGTADFLLRAEGTGAMLATVNAVLHSEVNPATRVMVVETNDALREHFILMIQNHGYPVVEARSPEEALALAERINIGVTIVNADLAQERDYWLIRRLRQLSATMSIFVLADALTDEQGKAALIRGASGYGETGELPDLLNRVREQDD